MFCVYKTNLLKHSLRIHQNSSQKYSLTCGNQFMKEPLK